MAKTDTNWATHLSPGDSDRQLLLTRVFDAPRALVWLAWTAPEHIARWWGPRGFTTRVEHVDLRTGGKWKYVMVGPDGTEYPVEGVFREVTPIDRIVTTDEFGEEYESREGNENLPKGIVLTCEFEDLPGANGRMKTRLTLRIDHPTAEDRRKHEAMGVVGGWGSSFECMDEHLSALRGDAGEQGGDRDREIVTTRTFDAPVERVWAVWTDPRHISKWWGPRGFTTTTKEWDLRPGGVWRFTMHGPDGTDYLNRVRYQEVVKGERLVYLHGGEGAHADIEFIAVVRFEAVRGGERDGGGSAGGSSGGDAGRSAGASARGSAGSNEGNRAGGEQTRVTLRIITDTKARRDGMAEFGAVEGGVQTLERFGEVLGEGAGGRDA